MGLGLIKRGVFLGLLALGATGAENATANSYKRLMTLEVVEGQEVKNRVALAAAQFAIIEEINKAACMAASGVKVSQQLAIMTVLRNRFIGVHNALLNGNDSFGLSMPEQRSRVIRAHQAVSDHWPSYNAAVLRILSANAVSPDLARNLLEGADEVVADLGIMMSEIQAAHTNPVEMTVAEALTMDFAARQEYRAQVIGKSLCLLNLGWTGEGIETELQTFLDRFDGTHEALLNGEPAVGLSPAPTPEIRATLTRFKAQWDALAPTVRHVLDGGTVSGDQLHEFSRQNGVVLQELDQLVRLYRAL